MGEKKKNLRLGICSCGCGLDMSIRTNKCTLRFYIKGHYGKGDRHLLFKEIVKHSDGYLLIHKPNHPFATKKCGYIFLHRVVWEEHNKACLLPYIDIHHKDGDKTNNDITNLEPMSRSKHMSVQPRIRDSLGRFGSKAKRKRKND